MTTADQPEPIAAARAAAKSVAEAVAQRLPVSAAWLFGSGAVGRLTPDSDLDVGLLLHQAPDALALATMAAELSGLVGRPVQLVDLRRAGPILGRQVLQHGILVLDNEPASRMTWQAHVLVDYDDLKHMRRPLEQALVRRLRDGH
jgi:predicted nucleotidyltransferase